MAEEVKVFGVWGSPMSRRVEMALKLKGIPYENIEEDLDNKSALLLKYNPVHKKIPVLVHNGNPLAESLVILEYIDETWKDNPIFPKDPYERALARFWAKFIDDKCIPALWIAFSGEENEREKAKEEASECLKHLEGALKGKRFFGGETIGYLDIAANVIGFWLGAFQDATGVELLTAEKTPALLKWSEEFVCHEGIKENLPPRERLIAASKKRFGK